jgi:transcription elongation factor SPT6
MQNTTKTILIKPGQNQYFRVIEFNSERMECALSCKSSFLKQDEAQNFDKYFDSERCQNDKTAELAAKHKQKKKNIHPRVTSHPYFHNVTFDDAEKMLRKMDNVK